MEINKIYNENCLDTLARMTDGFVDLTMTSPPYDNLRTYTGEAEWNEDVWKPIIKELYRVTKQGGVVVWVIGDATINGSETGTSFRQALWAKKCGFNLHDTMIWNKGKFSAVGSLKIRYAPVFEYMFVLVKGKLKTFNPLKDRENIRQSIINPNGIGQIRQKDGTMKAMTTKKKKPNRFGQRFNIWKIGPQQYIDHPAPFPKKLANDHIISWSNPGDLIFDPFVGSGTTAKMALLNNRNYIGSEISEKYCEIAARRLAGGVLPSEPRDNQETDKNKYGFNL